MSDVPPVVIDCRWLGIGGAGRTTELLLRGLAEDPPSDPWVLWGPRGETSAHAWPGARVEPVDGDPRSLLGQRRALAVPKGRLVLFMHQQRPLRPVPAVTLVYDTIPLRFGTTPLLRRVKRQFLRYVTSRSRLVVTISEHSKATIIRDLGVPHEMIEVMRFPFDEAFARRVRAMRPGATQAGMALYVGGFLPHKNIPRLLSAFEATRFRRNGGRLLLVGGSPEQVQDLQGNLTPSQRGFTEVRPACSQPQLEQLFASSLFLIQPSLEEGFGLPAWEAISCGLPVCVSDGGALPEVVAGWTEPFPATSTAAMTAAIDACAAQAERMTPADSERSCEWARGRAPTVGQFGAGFRRRLETQASS